MQIPLLGKCKQFADNARILRSANDKEEPYKEDQQPPIDFPIKLARIERSGSS